MTVFFCVLTVLWLWFTDKLWEEKRNRTAWIVAWAAIAISMVGATAMLAVLR